MHLLPPKAICEYCRWHYSIVCRDDGEKVYVAEHVEQCGRASQLAMAPDSKPGERNSLGSSTLPPSANYTPFGREFDHITCKITEEDVKLLKK